MSVVQFQANPEPQSIVYRAYAMRDIKSNTFSMPFFQMNKVMALRMFEDMSRDSQSQISKHPEDYQLFEIGVFDTATGFIDRYETVQFLATASEYK